MLHTVNVYSDMQALSPAGLDLGASHIAQMYTDFTRVLTASSLANTPDKAMD